MIESLVFCEKNVAVRSHFSTAIAKAIGIVVFAPVACRSFWTFGSSEAVNHDDLLSSRC